MILDELAHLWVPEPNTGCYIWIGQGEGYPRNKGRSIIREVCKTVLGPPPTSKHQAAHNTPNGCVGKFCVCPIHLRWATQSENIMDNPRPADINMKRNREEWLRYLKQFKQQP
jgi:hypothetical protein